MSGSGFTHSEKFHPKRGFTPSELNCIAQELTNPPLWWDDDTDRVTKMTWLAIVGCANGTGSAELSDNELTAAVNWLDQIGVLDV